MSKKFSISGNSADFPFEHRLFNNLCACSVLACVLTFIANWIIGLNWQLQAVIIGLFLFFCYLYYTARFKKRYKKAIVPYHISVMFFLSLMWFFNGGIQGPIGYFYFIAIAGVVIFLRNFWFVISLILANIITVILLDYFFHEWVILYPDNLSKYVDVIIGICVVSILLGVGIHLLKKNYDLEHNKVEEQKQQLTHINEVQNKLISVMSHDVRAPFNSLKGTLLLLKSDALSQDETKMLAGNLSQEVDNALNLVNNLLYWSQTQLQGLNPNPEAFDLQSIIEETIQLLKPQADKKLIRIHTHSLNTIVIADKEMTKTVLRNLLTNAIKFSYEGGEIQLSLQQNLSTEVIVGVFDSGVGMSAEQQENLFKPVHSSTLGTANEKGNGIGLMLCKDFVEKNGGRMWIESALGRGSKFYFTVNISKGLE
jgi:two-component system, sensor histidine kinase and response regulator